MSVESSSLTAAQLRHAADLKEKIDALTKELASILGAPAPVKAKGKMSASARAKISKAAKARWAKVRAAKPTVKPAAKAPGTKRKMSAAAKAKLSALAKARWAKIKTAGKKSL